jgi:DNA repair ATPase RecN
MSTEILTVKLEALHTDVSEIKSALDKVSEAITKLALVEQQQNQIASSLERAFRAIGKVEDRLAALEQATPTVTETAKWVDRGLVALAGAGAVLIGKTFGFG